MKSNTLLSLFGYSVIPLALLLTALLIIQQYEGSISPMPTEIVIDGWVWAIIFMGRVWTTSEWLCYMGENGIRLLWWGLGIF